MRSKIMSVIQLSIVLFALSAALTDLFNRRVPNSLCVIGCIYGCSLHILGDGWQGGVIAASGASAGFALSLVLYLLGAVGAGDVKWFAAAGAIAGPFDIAAILVLSVMVSGLFGVFAFVWSAQFRRTFQFFVTEVFYASSAASFTHFASLRKFPAVRFPYMVSVFAAAVLIQSNAVRWM